MVAQIKETELTKMKVSGKVSLYFVFLGDLRRTP